MKITDDEFNRDIIIFTTKMVGTYDKEMERLKKKYKKQSLRQAKATDVEEEARIQVLRTIGW